MSELSAQDVQVVYEADGPAQSLVLVAATDVAGADLSEAKWYPLIPIGHFNHLTFGEFTVSATDAEQYVANFNAGVPFGGGVPINEDGKHVKQAQAFGYIEELEARGDGVWGLIALSSIGQAAIADKRYRYISPRFAPSGRPVTTTGGEEYDNLLVAAALCNDPFFQEQPGLFAATAGYEFEPIADEEADETATTDEQNVESTDAHQTDVEVNAMTDEQKVAIREAYVVAKGDVTDDEWTALTAELETEEAWQEFSDANTVAADEETTDADETDEEEETSDEVTISAADLAALRAQADEAKSLEEKVADQGKELDTMAATVGDMTATIEHKRIHDMVAATVYGEKVPVPAAVDVLTALQMNPCEATVAATMAHLAENGGAIGLVEMGQRDMIAATDASGGDGEAWLQGHPVADDIKDQTRAIAKAEGCDMRTAYNKVMRKG